jgi:hypothetical protein
MRSGLFALAVAAAAAAPAPAAEKGAEVADLLAAVKKVGREGAGNAAAARAWKRLVARGPAVLTAVLAAVDDDNLTAANWLRPAVDAIAEKAVAAGTPLPAADLECFIADKSHSSAGRRLAYEVLCRADRTTPDRLLPKMLHDPSPDLRRDAVARVLTQARAAAAKKATRDAVAAYRKALGGACDPEQVEVIARELQPLGVKVDVAAHLGFVRRWHLIAPFDHAKSLAFDKAYPPERSIDLAAAYKGKGGKEVRWVERGTDGPQGVVDLNKLLAPHKGAIAYAFAAIDSPLARPVQVRAGSINGIKIFLNGKQIFAREEYHHGMEADQYVGRGTLKAGRNELLVKICQNEQTEAWAQDWKFQVRLCDAAGAAVPWTHAKPEAKGVKP